MKIRTDFVTNSSSVAYIIIVYSEEQLKNLKSLISFWNKDPDASNEGVRFWDIFRTKEELDTYVNDGPLDWARLPGGPRFICQNEETYKEWLQDIKEGKIVCRVACDWNVNERFEKDLYKYDWREYDL